MKKLAWMSLLIVPALAAGCAAAQPGGEQAVNHVVIENPYAPQEGDDALVQDGASVDSASWDATAQTLTLSGTMATPCHQLRVAVEQNDQRIDFNVYALSEPEVICAQMLEPFEAVFSMESFDPQKYRVFVNGQEMSL
ncbi:MAG: hypothetical protein PWQ55_187 [Chloroflexota bacterium]|nr:hypothetical protein [Chloroflexota bacterium]